MYLLSAYGLWWWALLPGGQADEPSELLVEIDLINREGDICLQLGASATLDLFSASVRSSAMRKSALFFPSCELHCSAFGPSISVTLLGRAVLLSAVGVAIYIMGISIWNWLSHAGIV
ncbi:hypothetical protein BC830DRAFT_964688 [Chytriomyces sp. MP71]|nr:hypothetical protein BC830DRAFT_964688 [Chytriomyces sp. MP71]